MMSLRTLTRSAPRSIARSLAVSTRATVSRPVAAVSQNAFTLKQITKPAYAAFSTSRAFKQAPGEGDVELVAKLEDELKHEKASGLEDLDGSVQNIQYVLQNNSWEVKDIPGEQEVTLTKKFGKEEIRLTFTVADLENLSEQEDFSADGISQLPEDRIAPSDRDEVGIDDLEPGFPARVNITIEKPGSGALLIQTMCTDGVFQVEEVSYFNKPDLALAQTAEKDWARQSLYAGPPFENLDEELQNFIDRYLDVRGINAELATMIPDYIQVKEQKEYVRWLENVKNFVSA